LDCLPYLDIHTHNRSANDTVVSVSNLSLKEFSSKELPKSYVSAGVHPWWIEDFSKEEIEDFKAYILELLKQNKLWAIGESGLDRTSPETMEWQKELFTWHLELSETYGLPLFIHNVRSGADFLQILKNRKPTSAWIFHDFRGNEELLNSLLKLHPLSFFSFGISIDNSPQIRELLPLVPLNRLFLETDDQKHLDIHDIYLRASQTLGIDLEFLKSQLWHNFKKVSKIISA
jgi:TatD DNase family protein